MNLRTRTCSLAVSAAFAAIVPLSAQAALPAPTSGTLEIWFKSPAIGATVSGLMQLDKCYLGGRGVSRVEFFVDGTRLNTDTSMADGMSCVLDTTKLSNGTHQLKAVAYDSSGRSYTELRSINIQNTTSGGSTTPPPAASGGVTITAPANGATLSGSTNACAASVPSGTTYVRFYRDGVWLNTDTSAPWTCNINTTGLPAGTHKLKVIALASGAVKGEGEISFNVGTGGSTGGSTTPPPPPPTTSSGGLSITAPANGATLSGSVNACAASVPSGTNYVRFYRDGVWLNTDTSAPHTCNINVSGLANGTHKLKAISYGANNVVSGQTEISFNVGTASSGDGTTNQAPSVSISSPAVSAVLSNTASCAGSAADSDGSIAKVDFLLGSTVVASDSASPYTCSFDTTRFANGSYTFTARATDNLGKTASVSRGVSIQNAASGGGDDGGSTGGGPISAADIVDQAQAEIAFSQQRGYNTQILNQYIQAPSIPETGMHAFALSNGETLRFGKYADPRNSARKVFAFQVDPKDVVTSGAKRAELKFGNNIEMDRVYWVAVSVYVYDWGTLSTSDKALFGLQQHNGSPADLSPNFSIITSGTGRTFQILALGSSSSSPTYGNTVSTRSAHMPIPFGRWADFVFKFKLNTQGSGFVQAWLDGTQYFEHRGILGYVTPGYKDFFKFGYYNWSGANFASSRKVLLRSPVIVADPTGSKYKPEDLRAYVNAH